MLTKKNISGFSLAEMAIVLAIIALLLGGLLPTLSAQRESQHISETRKLLGEIQETLTGFTIANGRLPWPACGTIPSGQANAGIELSPASAAAIVCTGDMAVVPWATLGINETDAWGNRFTYRVTDFFADNIQERTLSTWTGNSSYSAGNCVTPTSPNSRYYQAQLGGSSDSSQPVWPSVTGQTVVDNSITWIDMGSTSSQSTFELCSRGDITIRIASGSTMVASNIPAAIISHGKNGMGAYTQQGTQLPSSSNADEQENSDGNTNSNYVSHTPTQTFDDLVVWISPNILINRMVTAGKLP